MSNNEHPITPMANPKPLSPAAQAVWDAVWDTAIQCGDIKGTRRSQVAAALRAAAVHIDDASDGLECQDILRQIADELENY